LQRRYFAIGQANLRQHVTRVSAGQMCKMTDAPRCCREFDCRTDLRNPTRHRIVDIDDGTASTSVRICKCFAEAVGRSGLVLATPKQRKPFITCTSTKERFQFCAQALALL
jgi:hypothetical protein